MRKARVIRFKEGGKLRTSRPIRRKARDNPPLRRLGAIQAQNHSLPFLIAHEVKPLDSRAIESLRQLERTDYLNRSKQVVLGDQLFRIQSRFSRRPIGEDVQHGFILSDPRGRSWMAFINSGKIYPLKPI